MSNFSPDYFDPRLEGLSEEVQEVLGLDPGSDSFIQERLAQVPHGRVDIGRCLDCTSVDGCEEVNILPGSRACRNITLAEAESRESA